MIPPSVRITAKVAYPVRMVDRFSDTDTLGECSQEPREIRIRSDLSPRLTLITFIHEVLHAMQFEYGIKIPHASVNQLDSAIEACLRLNKWL